MSRNLDLSRDHGIVYALRRWGWHASQVLDARDDPERWKLVCAWVRVVHRMGAKVRNPGAYVMRCVMSGKRPKWEPVSGSGGSPARQPARELTQEQRRQRYLEPVEELYRDDEAPASETGAGDARDEVGLAGGDNQPVSDGLENRLNLPTEQPDSGKYCQRDQRNQQRVLGEILPTLLTNPSLYVVEPQHVIPPACCSPSIGAESLESVTESVRDWLEWGANKSGSVFRRGLGPPTRSPRGRSSAGGRTLTLLPASIGPPGPAVNEVGNLTMVLEDYGGPAPPRYSDRGLTVRAA